MGRNFITAAIPEIGQMIAGKKKLKSAAKDSMKKSVSKTISESTTANRSRPRPPKRLRSTHASRGRGLRVTAPSARQAAGRSATQNPLSTNKLEIIEIPTRKRPAQTTLKTTKTKRSRSDILSNEFTSIAADIANPVTHTTLDFFEKPNVLVNYESGFDQEIYPQVGSRGPTLDFLISGDQRNCIDLNYIQLGIQVSIYTPDGKDRVKASDASKVVFANNALHSLFSQGEVYTNGILISDSNNSHHHRAFLETELTTNSDSKETWAACQGYSYDSEPSSDANQSEW